MTLIGADVASYQTGLDLSKVVPDLAYVIAKTSEGTYYTDPSYQGFRSQTAHLGKPFLWYHVVSQEAALNQVEHTLECVGDPTLPGMMDCERLSAPGGPTWPQILAYARQAVSTGLNLRLIYLPHWYWEQIGSPDLTPLESLGLSLVSSQYENPNSPAYPGDQDSGWNSYGGLTPEFYQFTDNDPSAVGAIDLDAYRGDQDQLSALLAPRKDLDMGATFASGQVAAGLAPDGTGAKTVVCLPPANTGTNWADVWISFGADFGTATLRVAGYVHGTGWRIFDQIQVPANADRVNPFGGPAPAGLQKVSVTRLPGSENVPVGWMVEARSK